MLKFDFNKVAGKYDDYYQTDTGRKIDAVEKWQVKQYLDRIEEKEALEIGCGTGHWSMFFSDNGFQVTGIDIAEQMMQKAIEKDIPGAVFMKMDAENLMFPSESVKNIFTMASAEFTHNRQKFFDEAYRVLKRGGHFLIGALNRDSLMGKNKQNDPVFKDADFFSYDELQRLLNRFGHPGISGCVLMNEKGEVLDYPRDKDIPQECLNNEGAFLVGFVKKL